MDKKNFFGTFLFFLILSSVLFLLSTSGVLKPLSRVSEPVLSLIRISVNNNQDDLSAKLSKLSDQKKLEAEVKALRDQFESGRLSANALLPARVIGAPTFIPGTTPPQTLVIDKGEEDGVKTGMAAVLDNNLVGSIAEVGAGFSKVTLVTNDSFSTTAKTGNNLGVVKGDGGNGMILGNVALSASLNKDDIVYTKGSVGEDGVGIMPDLIVGRVISVDKKASDLFQKAEVKSAVNFATLNYVFLVLR